MYSSETDFSRACGTSISTRNIAHKVMGQVISIRIKKIFYLLGTFIAKETGAPRCVWHFSETSRRKGTPDGVGGNLKRTADNITAQGHDITGQDEFVSLLKSSCPDIKVIGINKDADAEMKKIDDL
ncbi:hypothetical protein AVEN_153343-1 [Araneus ventricosus]|uniref:Uncharacterized protein n=1 Tax=Araneus ventricosus TaxID=182803 RepID=A0A4Y2ERK0_ARAVE|nr:hypothetical protein AVEN_153343-1 [Araneus ventricosus]